ncbi:MAG: cytochrome c3 family protein [Methylobacter sp.]
MLKRYLKWIIWLLVTVAIAAVYLSRLEGNDKRIFLPGQTSSGHHQIELNCDACHTDPFSTSDDMQEACVKCHGAELKQIKDSHPKSKFTDPRNADHTKILDARYCVACHVEHKPDITSAMGVTLPDGFCIKCHQKVADDRPSHKGMDFTSCASAGCHNFHDNRALYEDFLVNHAGEPVIKAPAVTPLNNVDKIYRSKHANTKPLTSADIDAPDAFASDAKINHDWASTRHAKAGVNCSGCHHAGNTKEWLSKPTFNQCKTCHSAEAGGFLEGKHGMRLKADLPAMQPKNARIPMSSFVKDKQLSCVSCHRAHEFNTHVAAVEACESCHVDRHSQNYRSSRHFQLWLQEQSGNAGQHSGVSCATCHLPSEQQDIGDESAVATQHNQNKNLRPNEKMIRSVCLHCHSLEFSIDALADKNLIINNFAGKPAHHIKSIDMANKRK